METITDGFQSQMVSNAVLLYFLGYHPEQAIKQTVELPVVWTAKALMWRHGTGNNTLYHQPEQAIW